MPRPTSTGARLQKPEDAVCGWDDCRRSVSALPICWDHALEAHAIVQATFASIIESQLQTLPGAGGPRPGYVYFIQFGDRIKIGFSTDPENRVRALPHDKVLAVIPGTRLNERQLHAAFADLRLTGEWFREDQRIHDFVADVKDASEAQVS